MKRIKSTNSDLFSEEGKVESFKPLTDLYDKPQGEVHDAQQDLPMGTETILFVDDEKVVLEVNRDSLEYLGYRVLTASSGCDAIDIYRKRQNEIHLVIQDMVMPGMNGAETFRAFKELNPAVKVILASGYVMERQIGTVMQQGCRAFIQKPFRLEDLAYKVREILDSP